MSKGKEALGESLYEATHFNVRFDHWSVIKDDIVRIERECFGDNGYSKARLKRDFEDPTSVVVLMEAAHEGRVIGYTYARPKEDSIDTAEIYSTAILPAFQDRGYLGLMMGRLERELQHKGFKYIERDAAIENGYADSIEKHYGNRVVAKRDHGSVYGQQRFFVIDIRPYWERGRR